MRIKCALLMRVLCGKARCLMTRKPQLALTANSGAGPKFARFTFYLHYEGSERREAVVLNALQLELDFKAVTKSFIKIVLLRNVQ